MESSGSFFYLWRATLSTEENRTFLPYTIHLRSVNSNTHHSLLSKLPRGGDGSLCLIAHHPHAEHGGD